MALRHHAPLRLIAVLIGGLMLLTACEPEPTATTSSTARSSLDMVNHERHVRGIPRLAQGSDLQKKAQDHANYMARNRKLSHSNLAAGVHEPYRRLGENVGVGSSVRQVHDTFMASSTHRNHILNSGYSSIGVGVAKGSDGKYYVAQVFKG